MVKRILMVILIVLSLSLLLSIESDDINGEGESDSHWIILEYDEDSIEVEVNGIGFKSGIPIKGTSNELYSIEIVAYSKKIGHDTYRMYAGTAWSCSTAFAPNYSDFDKTMEIFLEKNTYEISFDGNNNTTCTFGGSIIMPNLDSPSKGYAIEKWSYNNSTYPVNYELYIDESFLTANEIDNNKKLSFKSVLAPITYKTKYNLNGGSATYADEIMTIDMETPITMPNDVPVKDGSLFKGWKIGEILLQCGEKYNLNYSAIDSSDTVTITAQWSASVNSNLSHCTLTTSFEYADYGEEWSATLTPDGHYELPSDITSDCFIYTLNSDGTATITVSNVTEAITISITAVPIEHTITLDPDGGTLEGSNTITVNEVSNVSLPTPVKARHVFNGWFDDTTEITETKSFTSDKTLKASWTKTVFLVRFLNAPDGAVLSSCETSGPVTKPSENPTKSGCTFVKWTSSTAGDFTGTVTDDTDYRPVWSANKVRFYLDEDAESYDEYETLKLTELPTPPARDGWKFDHWYYYSNGIETEYTLDNKDNNIVYAKWIKITFIVRFYSDEGDTNPSEYVTTGTIAEPAEKPTKSGYTFVKWTSSTTGDFTGTVTDDTEYYPVWSANKVRFYLDEDAEPYDEYETLKLTELPTPPSREGWKFDHWYYYSNGIETEYTLDNKDNNIVYAKWIKTIFQVNFYDDDGKVISSCKTTGPVTVLPTEPTKEGYAFDYWITLSNKKFTGTVTGDTDYHPKWREVHTVSFYLNEGDEIPYVEYDAYLMDSLPTPERYGWKFDYWYCYADDGTEKKFIGDIGEDVKVYASWTQTIFNVRFFDNDGGTVIHTCECEIGKTFDKPTENPTKTGYSFVCWMSSDGEYSGTVTKDTEYYPKWKENTIRFYLRDGVTVCKECKGPELTDLPVPAEEYGWKFDYWYYESGEDKIEFTGDIGRDVDVYSLWIKTVFKVRFLYDPDGDVYEEYETTGAVTVPEANPSRTGYSFMGWTSSDGGLKTTVTDDTDFHAEWVAHKIRFYLNEGDETPYDECEIPSMTELPKPTRDRYEFNYWYYKSDGKNIEYTEGIGRDVDVYGSWNKVLFCVEFLDKSEGKRVGYYETKGTITDRITAPVRTGYTFEKWTSSTAGDYTGTVTDDTVYFAVWSVNVIKFYLDEDGKVYKEFNAPELDKIPTPPPRDKWAFSYWYYKSGDEKIPYSIDNLNNNDVYAKWIKTVFQVNFYEDSSKKKLIAGYETPSEVKPPTTVPAKDGYVFTRWITLSNEELTGTVSEDTDYYPDWKKVYKIRMYLDTDGTLFKEYNTSSLPSSLPEPPPPDGYTFVRWYYKNGDSETEFVRDIGCDVDVYASWKEVSDESGGSSEGGGTTPVTDPSEETSPDDTKEGDKTEKKTYEHRFYIDSEGKKIWRIGDSSGISETPTRDGYTFGGWYILIDGEKIPYTEGLNVDINVYAEWIPIKTDGGGNPMIPAAAIASVLAVVLIVLVVGRKIS